MFQRTSVHMAQLVPMLVCVLLDSAHLLTHLDDSHTSACSPPTTFADLLGQRIRISSIKFNMVAELC